jgi:hypothetical protein
VPYREIDKNFFHVIIIVIFLFNITIPISNVSASDVSINSDEINYTYFSLDENVSIDLNALPIMYGQKTFLTVPWYNLDITMSDNEDFLVISKSNYASDKDTPCILLLWTNSDLDEQLYCNPNDNFPSYYSASISPDGDFIAVCSGDGSIHILPVFYQNNVSEYDHLLMSLSYGERCGAVKFDHLTSDLWAIWEDNPEGHTDFDNNLTRSIVKFEKPIEALNNGKQVNISVERIFEDYSRSWDSQKRIHISDDGNRFFFSSPTTEHTLIWLKNTSVWYELDLVVDDMTADGLWIMEANLDPDTNWKSVNIWPSNGDIFSYRINNISQAQFTLNNDGVVFRETTHAIEDECSGDLIWNHRTVTLNLTNWDNITEKTIDVPVQNLNSQRKFTLTRDSSTMYTIEDGVFSKWEKSVTNPFSTNCVLADNDGNNYGIGIFAIFLAILYVINMSPVWEEEEKQRVEREAQRVEGEAQARRYRNEQRKKKEEKNRKLWNVRKMRLLTIAVEMFSDIKSFEMDYQNEKLEISIGCEPYTIYIEYPDRPVFGMSFGERTKTYANLEYSNALTRTDQSIINEMLDDKNRKVWIKDKPYSRNICPDCGKRYSSNILNNYCTVCDDDADC